MERTLIVGFILKRRYLVRALLVFMFLLFASISSPFAYASDDEDTKIKIDADNMTYEDSTGIAKAEGNVKLRNKDMRLFSPYVEYDTENDTVNAYSDSSSPVTLMVGGKKISGSHLKYSIASRRGVMSDASGKTDAIFFKGKDLEVMPLEDAVSQHVVSSRYKVSSGSKNASDDDMVARWLEVESTTCDFKNPHYRFVSKEIVVLPGKKIVIKQPSVYLGKRMVFKYPFDFTSDLSKIGKRKTKGVLPVITYNSDKGAGIGISGPIAWESGQLDIEASYWTNDIWEAAFRLHQKVYGPFSIFAETERTYNEDEKAALWRPKWGVSYLDTQGWSALLFESQRELVKIEMRPGKDRRYDVWRAPEFQINSPWFSDPAAGGYYRLMGVWGKYQDNVSVTKPWVERVGYGVQIYGEPLGESIFKPFYNAKYWHYDYKDSDMKQDITDAVLGVRWNVGAFGLETAYVRRITSGSTPLEWDRYVEREDVYQKVSVTFPGQTSYENWTVSLRGAYDFYDEELAEMVYSLAYKKHCLTWELWARDSRVDSNFTIGLKFRINAYPDSELAIGVQEIYDPFEVPSGINKEK